MIWGGKSWETCFTKGKVGRQYILADGKLQPYSIASREQLSWLSTLLRSMNLNLHFHSISDSLKPNPSEVNPVVCSLLSCLTQTGNDTKWFPGGMANRLFCYGFLYLVHFQCTTLNLHCFMLLDESMENILLFADLYLYVNMLSKGGVLCVKYSASLQWFLD